MNAEKGFTPMAASARLIKRDVSWGRFGGKDLLELQTIARRMLVSLSLIIALHFPTFRLGAV